MKKITLANYREDRHYAHIVKATENLLRERRFIAPLELFIRMELLSEESVEHWRRSRIPYLERVICCNLSKASRILRILRMHAHDLDLKPMLTVYKRWTKGAETPLRFSKTGDRAVEDAYARHFLPLGKDAEDKFLHLGCPIYPRNVTVRLANLPRILPEMPIQPSLSPSAPNLKRVASSRRLQTARLHRGKKLRRERLLRPSSLP